MLLFARLFWSASLSLPLSLPIILGVVGWLVMFSACAIVIVHPKPEATFLGWFALIKEPLLRDDIPERKRVAFTFSVVLLAILAVIISLLFFTDAVYVLFDKYVL